MVVVGLVVEGTHDYHMLQPLITFELRKRTAEPVHFRHLQPMQDATGNYNGGGWSRVAAWCMSFSGASVDTFFTPLFAGDPVCDFVIVHLDGDALEDLGPHTAVVLPQAPSIDDRVGAIANVIENWLALSAARRSTFVFAVPVMHTEAWILCAEGVAACEGMDAKQLFRSTYSHLTDGKLGEYYKKRCEQIIFVDQNLDNARSYDHFKGQVAVVTI